MYNKVAFADEYGNNSFDFESQTTHFIVASVIFNEENISETELKLEEIRKKYFQTGEMKSSGISKNDKRRKLILRELVALDFSIYAVVADKRKLYSEGFKYKASFYKFLNGLVYSELFKNFPDLKLAVDEHGANDFMRQFKKYVQTNHTGDLFSKSQFEFISSKNSNFIQLADIIAGTLGHCFDENNMSNNRTEFLQILRPRLSSINHFPQEVTSYQLSSTPLDIAFDERIASMAVNSANHFIASKEIKKQDDIDQVNCAKLLLLYFNNYSKQKYISTNELLRHLNAGRVPQLTVHAFRTKVIAKLRDKGVIISSSSSGEMGYKLPSSKEDLHKFVNHGKQVIIPMLKRIEKLRDTVMLASSNDIDVLQPQEFKAIEKLISKFK
ncbi:DUF3800 domain-containing protein [Taibaiella lutea]|uniref:DUF3800 domain-containing protein n=1 Tax=Taibaiella lutea TaxID=2608001 RepID=A0A5M6CSV4_9BACT|nr:DUF3800 domain-containing protein [Taibaiella lutea]KAA5537042.1 DUF3800 domain-containing protein [Taibaiella lutea]